MDAHSANDRRWPLEHVGWQSDCHDGCVRWQREVRHTGGVVVQNAEFEREIVASTSVYQGEARARLVVHVEGREPELTELLDATFDLRPWSQEVDVAVRRVEPTAEQDGLGNAPKHEEWRLDCGQLAKQFQVIGIGWSRRRRTEVAGFQ